MQPSQVELVVKSSSATSRRRSSTSWEAEKARLRRCRTAAVLAVTVLAGLAALLVPLGYWASHRTTQHVPLGSSGLGVSPTVLATLRDDWKEEGTPDPTAIMRLTISIAPKQDLEATHELLSNISTPGHPMHRQFLSASELRALVANDAGAAQVRAWLEGGGATIVFVGAHGLHFEVEAPVKVWERLLKVSFIRLVYIGSSSSAARRRRLQASQSAPTLIMRPIHRARGRPHVPEALAGSVRAIHGLSSLPPRLHAEGPLRRPLVQADENPTEASATPASETPVGVAERRRLGGAPWINAEGCSVDPCEASEGGARRLQAWQGDPEGAKASHICCAPATEGARRMQASEGGARRLQAWQGDPEGRQACTDDAVEAGRRLMQGVQATPLADAAGLHGICVNGSALNSTTIGLMRKTYQIPDGAGNDAVVQYLLTPLPKPHSPSDLRAFQVLYGLNETNVSSHCLGVYGKCEDDSAYGALEANLDAQYLSAVAPNAQVVEQYFDVWDDDGCHGPHCWLGNLAQCANDDCASSSCSFDPCFGKPPPSVVSISWGVPEIDLTEGDVHTFNQNAAYLALLGVTIVVAAGDGGAAGMFHPPTDDDSQPVHAPVCGSTYQALFPASSPYVTAVGATQGIESAQEEAGCSAGSGGGITSGGGFSLTKYSKKTTPWQVSHVTDYLRTPQGAQAQQGYFEHVSYSYDTDNSEYASSGRIATHRAYPDLALAGSAVQVVNQGKVILVDGTSVSAPLFAGMVAAVVADRKAEGMRANDAAATQAQREGTDYQKWQAAKGYRLGWLNPTLYANAGSFRDVTAGNNTDGRGVVCDKSFSSDRGYQLQQDDDNHMTPADQLLAGGAAGFAAATGWDPVSGLGSIELPSLKAMFSTKVATDAGAGCVGCDYYDEKSQDSEGYLYSPSPPPAYGYGSQDNTYG